MILFKPLSHSYEMPLYDRKKMKFSTNFGEPLSEESQRYIKAVRLKLTQPIHPVFDTDFNLYRFIMGAERLHKKEKEIVETAAKAVNNHLRIRQALKLDTEPVRSFDENPIFQLKLMPRGDIQDASDAHNRLLWYIEYATITVESIAHSIRSSEACKYQFMQFEHMLRRVMEQEEKTGRLSSLRHIVDMNGYEINPFTMLFVTSGSLAYYSQLFHYENYPELVAPVDFVNIAKWIHVPYKIAKTMMPSGFADKFRLHDNHFMKSLLEDIKIEDIPESLGGTNKKIKCKGAEKVDPSNYWKPTNTELLDQLETLHVGARKNKHVSFDVTEPVDLSWYFRTDGDTFFGVFYEESPATNSKDKDGNFDTESVEMAYPWLKLAAKLVHEQDSLDCSRPGRYHVVFCNKHSWLSRRTVDLFLLIKNKSDDSAKRLYFDGTFSSTSIQLN